MILNDFFQCTSQPRMNLKSYVQHVYTLLILWVFNYMSCIMRKPDICICENKDADQLRGNREADQRLCFRYIDSTITLLHIYEI